MSDSANELLIEAGRRVRIHYSVKSEGSIVETTSGKPPLYFVQGSGSILPALQKRLEGKKEGDKIEFELVPSEAYGPYREEAVEEIPMSEMPQVDLKPGLILQEEQPDGTVKVGKIIEIKDASVVMDFNHPMAGKVLFYSVEVINVMKEDPMPGIG